MAAFDVTKKLHIYHTLYRLNRSFASIVAHCHTLQESGVIPVKSARLYQGLTQELQSEINGELLETMHNTELDDWNRYGKVGQAREKELRGKDEAHAERKKQTSKQRRKARS
ncbi:MAG TPA: hypothetical protein VH724_06475 [Candidatus Angelobacter sp.]|nr:hypothetical protein [Candidatus Angelobacter sp.]